jgi:hypothetical protein
VDAPGQVRLLTRAEPAQRAPIQRLGGQQRAALRSQLGEAAERVHLSRHVSERRERVQRRRESAP